MITGELKVGDVYSIVLDCGVPVNELGIVTAQFDIGAWLLVHSVNSRSYYLREELEELDVNLLTERQVEWLLKMNDSMNVNERVIRELIASRMTGKTGTGEAKKEEPKEEIKIEDAAIPEGWVAYTSIFGSTFTTREHPVKKFEDADWPEHLRGYIPDADPNYVFPKKETEVFVVALMNPNDKPFIHGPKGSGKSSLTEQVCARLRIPFIRVNCREDMESSAIFGSITIKEGTMGWAPGPAEDLGLNGGVLQIDEISATPAGINMAMQWMLEENGKIYLADKPVSAEEKFIKPHQWFRIVATDNTQLQGDQSGHYAGTQVQNEALADRFTTTIELGYLSRDHETQILKRKCPKLPAHYIKDMLELASMIRTGYTQGKIQFTMSPRALINWGRKIEYWGDPILALQIAFFDKLVEEDKKQVNALVHKIFAREVK